MANQKQRAAARKNIKKAAAAAKRKKTIKHLPKKHVSRWDNKLLRLETRGGENRRSLVFIGGSAQYDTRKLGRRS